MRRILVLLAVGIPALAAATWMGEALAQPADPLAGWQYPGATQLASGSGGGYYMVLATTDGPDKVEAFYGKKVGQTLTGDHPGGTSIRGGDGEVAVNQDDSIQPGPRGERRPVVVRIFVQRTKDHYLTLVITRAKGEDQTHISLTSIRQ